MSLLKALFTDTKDQVWSQLAAQIGGTFRNGGFFGVDAVQARFRDWIVTLDHYTVSTGKSSTTYTRIRAPFINESGFKFEVYPTNFLFELIKRPFGLADIEIGHPEFDRRFVVRGNDQQRVQWLLNNPTIRTLVSRQPTIYFSLRDIPQPVLGERRPVVVDEVYFHVIGIITDPYRLRDLFDLFAEVLNQLCHMDPAYQDDPRLHMAALQQPGGQIKEGGLVLWDGDFPRLRAIEALGRLQFQEAVPTLAHLLNDTNPEVRIKSLDALGELGDPWCIPTLIPFTASVVWQERQSAARALSRLGRPELAQAMEALMRGDPSHLAVLTEFRERVVMGLEWALLSQPFESAGFAASALHALGATESLPKIRAAFRRVPRAEEAVRARMSAAMDGLQEHASLPHPAEAPQPDISQLPTPAEPSSTDASRLPRIEP